MFVASLHLAGLFFLSLFRVVEYVALSDLIVDATAPAIPAFLKGLLFDNVMMSYVSILPLAVLLLCASFGCVRRWLHRAAAIWYGAWLALMFVVSASNIPFFCYFLTNINTGVFAWFDQPDTVVGMALGDSTYIMYVLLYFVILALLVAAIVTICRTVGKRAEKLPASKGNPCLRVVVSLALVFLCFVGIRGTWVFTKRPISQSAAYYCGDAFLNQLGISPSFNLVKSFSNDMKEGNGRLGLMDDSEAVAAAREYLGVTVADSSFVIRRHVAASCQKRKPNIVLILMESMSANFMQRFGCQQRLTPTLDSLARHSLFFTNFYSAGTHTNQGIMGTLYSFPALMKRNVMCDVSTRCYNGLPTVLQQQGYNTSFFMTHWNDFDNMNAVFASNGYEHIYSREDYPESEVVNNYGVSDHFLFDYALRTLNGQSKEGRPFFATLLSISNHPPYVVPSYYQAKAETDEMKAVEYADWALACFLDAARQQPWYANTIFVMLGDHGKVVGRPDAEVAQSSHHIPLFIFGPGVENGVYDGLGMQVDVMPTVLGLLGIDYDYDGFGTDLLQERHSQVFYSTDDCIVARDSTSVYIHHPSTGQATYYASRPDGSYRQNLPQDENATALARYVKSMVQTADYLTRQRGNTRGNLK